MRLFAPLFLLVLALPAFTQTPGDCVSGTAEADLDYSDVRARLYNTGGLFFEPGNSTPHYEVPRGSGLIPIWAANTWVGGLISGNLRTAAGMWDGPYEFYPGPLAPTAIRRTIASRSTASGS